MVSNEMQVVPHNMVPHMLLVKYGSRKDCHPLRGQSFKIGGTTHLLLLGIDPWIVMVQGRWGSQ